MYGAVREGCLAPAEVPHGCQQCECDPLPGVAGDMAQESGEWIGGKEDTVLHKSEKACLPY